MLHGKPCWDRYPRQIWPSLGVLERNNFPCVTMLSWADGSGTARFWVLRMMIEILGGAGTIKSVVSTTVYPSEASSHVFAKGFKIRDGSCGYTKAGTTGGCVGMTVRQVVLLVNKAHDSTSVTVTGAKGSNCSRVDFSAGFGGVPFVPRREFHPWRSFFCCLGA
jgi:hypothetical protein